LLQNLIQERDVGVVERPRDIVCKQAETWRGGREWRIL
jgi:hypothetical protein